MIVIAVVAAWLAVGALVGLSAARHGHWSRLWVLTAVLGPLSVPLVVAAHRRGLELRPRPLHRASPGPGEVDVLVGVDGSPASVAAASGVADLFGPRLRRMTLAAVLDYDTAAPHAESILYPEPGEEELAAEQTLHSTARAVAARGGTIPATVVLAGAPADALERHAAEEGYDVIVVGARGHGLSRRLLGSCTTRLVRRARVPVLVVSEPERGPVAGAEDGPLAGTVDTTRHP